MTQQEMEQALELHNKQFARIDAALADAAERIQALTAGEQVTRELINANAEQIAANTAGLFELRGILADYLSSRNQQQ